MPPLPPPPPTSVDRVPTPPHEAFLRRGTALQQATSRLADAVRNTETDRYLIEAVQTGNLAEVKRISASSSELALVAKLVGGVLALEHDPEWGLNALLETVVGNSDPGQSRFIRQYLSDAMITVKISDECTIEEPIGRNLAGLLLVEAFQANRDFESAIQIAAQLDRTSSAVLSLAELYTDAEMWEAVLSLTSDVHNLDDITAFTLIFRARSFRQMGRIDSAFSTIDQVVSDPRRSRTVRFQALIERAWILRCSGQISAALAELERIRSEDATYAALPAAILAIGQPIFTDRGPSKRSPGQTIPPQANERSAGWLADPTGRYQYRYWDGVSWTAHVASHGSQGVDTA